MTYRTGSRARVDIWELICILQHNAQVISLLYTVGIETEIFGHEPTHKTADVVVGKDNLVHKMICKIKCDLAQVFTPVGC